MLDCACACPEPGNSQTTDIPPNSMATHHLANLIVLLRVLFLNVIEQLLSSVRNGRFQTLAFSKCGCLPSSTPFGLRFRVVFFVLSLKDEWGGQQLLFLTGRCNRVQ